MPDQMNEPRLEEAEASFAAAEGHYYCSNLIGSKMEEFVGRTGFAYTIPIVPSSFALQFLAAELYLHSLHALLGLPATEENHLGTLYKALPKRVRTDIEVRFREALSKSQMVRVVRKDSGAKAPKVGPLLNKSGYGLDEWMYWPDMLDDKGKLTKAAGTIGLPETMQAFRVYILELKPEWARHRLLEL